MRKSIRDAAIIIAASGVTTLNVFLQGALTVAITIIGKDLDFKEADLHWPINVFLSVYDTLFL